MTVKKRFFSSAYKVKKQEDINSLYTAWATTYDAELSQMEYLSPKRCASALAKFVSFETPILDFGCGTGLSGQALKRVGFNNIYGTEINSNMRKIAEQKGIYTDIFDTDIKNPFPEKARFYAICAVGVISSGAGPPALLKQSLKYIEKEGFICFSYNDHTLATASYMNAINALKRSGEVNEVFCEYGDHLKSENIGSVVYVLQKRI